MEQGNRAIVLKEVGEAEKVLQLMHLPKPRICPGHVLVRILLRPVHNFDLVLCSDISLAQMFWDLGKYADTLRNTGVVVGHEGGLGIVEEIGEGAVTLCAPGQRVHLDITYAYFLAKFQGSWQDYMLIKEEHVVHVPKTVADDIAAQLSSNPFTVYVLLKEIDSPKGEYLLITAAASVVGRLFIQLAKQEGYKTIAVVRREDLKEELLSLGAEAVINSALEDIPKVVKQITNGKGAYLGIDLVGGILTKSVAASVRDGGQVLVVGELEKYCYNLNETCPAHFISTSSIGMQLKLSPVYCH